MEYSINETFVHRVVFTKDLFSIDNLCLKNQIQGSNTPCDRSKVLIFGDQGLFHAQPNLFSSISGYFEAHFRDLHLLTSPIILPGGEAVKSDQKHVEKILSSLNKHGICRHSVVIAIGGGSLIDAVGFCCSIAHRGVRHIRIPTTSLAQADASIGIKNGINHFGKKNFLGTFAIPQAVVIDPGFLKSLSDEEWMNGLSEALKVALIKDKEFFKSIENSLGLLRQRLGPTLETVIKRSAELHLVHICTSGDPFEKRNSRPLDYGHWSAHKIEQISDFEISHGRAVAIGSVLDSVYSYLLGILSASDLKRILVVYFTLDFDLWPQSIDKVCAHDYTSLLEGLEDFRQHLGGELNISLLSAIGKSFSVSEISVELMVKSIDFLRKMNSLQMASPQKRQDIYSALSSI